MTLEKLLGLSADEWDQLTEADLEKWSIQFHGVTRPDPKRVKETKEATKRITKTNKTDQTLQKVQALAQQLGIKL